MCMIGTYTNMEKIKRKIYRGNQFWIQHNLWFLLCCRLLLGRTMMEIGMRQASIYSVSGIFFITCKSDVYCFKLTLSFCCFTSMFHYFFQRWRLIWDNILFPLFHLIGCSSSSGAFLKLYMFQIYIKFKFSMNSKFLISALWISWSIWTPYDQGFWDIDQPSSFLCFPRWMQHMY